MVQLLPFCGWRYDLSQVGALSEVLAPPAELIEESLQRELYRRHPCNSVRLISNRDEPGDTSPADRTNRADDFFRLWKRERILIREHDSALYVVETTFPFEGLELSRWSVTALLRLPEPANSGEFAGDVDSADPVRERLALRQTCRAGFEPVVGLLEAARTGADAESESFPDLLESLVRQVPPVESLGDDGTRHRLWPLADRESRGAIADRFTNLSLRLISGATEYAAAIQYRDELIAAGRMTDPNDPAQFVMGCFISVEDPSLMVTFPTTHEPDFLPSARRSEVLRTSGLRLHPPVPVGLVFAVMDHCVSV